MDHITPLGLGGANQEPNFQILHRDCHAGKTRHDRAVMAKADRQAKAHLGLNPKRQIMPGSRASKYKRTMRGETVLREREYDT